MLVGRERKRKVFKNFLLQCVVVDKFTVFVVHLWFKELQMHGFLKVPKVESQTF